MSKALQALRTAWPLAAILLLHTLLQVPHLQLDFWNDELYTLRHFVLVPASHAASDYHVPNNHIFFSLLAHGWATLAGISSVQEAITHVVWLRLLPFLCSCLSICFVFFAARKIEKGFAAPLAALLLVTTIPFYNFSAQMRGYSLSMCLFAALGYAAVSARKKAGWAQLASIFLLSLACVYTLPTNAFFLAAAVLSVSGAAFFARKEASAILSRNSAFKMALAIAGGAVAAALIYLPLLPQMQAWQAHVAEAAHPLENARHAMPVVAYHFLSARYLLLLLALVFLWKEKRLRLVWLWTMGVLFCLPFLLADLRVGAAPHRVFLTTLPLLCLGLALAISRTLAMLKKHGLRSLAFVGLCAYCIIVFDHQLARTRTVALTDAQRGTRRLDLYYQYNLHFFNPQADAKLYLQGSARPGIPLINACETENDLLKYIRIEGAKIADETDAPLPRVLQQCDTLDVMTEQPTRLRDSLQRLGWQGSTKPLLQGVHRIQILRLTKAAP